MIIFIKSYCAIKYLHDTRIINGSFKRLHDTYFIFSLKKYKIKSHVTIRPHAWLPCHLLFGFFVSSILKFLLKGFKCFYGFYKCHDLSFLFSIFFSSSVQPSWLSLLLIATTVLHSPLFDHHSPR